MTSYRKRRRLANPDKPKRTFFPEPSWKCDSKQLEGDNQIPLSIDGFDGMNLLQSGAIYLASYLVIVLSLSWEAKKSWKIWFVLNLVKY